MLTFLWQVFAEYFSGKIPFSGKSGQVYVNRVWKVCMEKLFECRCLSLRRDMHVPRRTRTKSAITVQHNRAT
jgi:hypothetical protein